MKKRRNSPVARSINGVIFGLKTPDRYANSSQRTKILDDLRPIPNNEVPEPEKPTVRGTKATLIITDDL